ncbi:hypothetical protein [Streptomyces spectabilis]|jgi:hypothetical protein|uniref:Uncharacterized protein n=1 Tax=Streptomyces spectabilis TaxID=68270 RepID=A0A7W8B510_STRST|nr:hypothetical protein [Streptomyces spectabilis]MBB5109325.1 hypothetical protein [Streptomyces spectabilis]GGV52420.1 hypothetical protein GCM10010245_82540 [Streptomyces spectabilis]
MWWKITVIVLALVAIVSTPLAWLRDGPDMGQAVGASVQAAVGVAALVWALFQHPARRADDSAEGTGQAQAGGGGAALSGIKRPPGSDRSAVARNTGDATATGAGSTAVSGIDYS